MRAPGYLRSAVAPERGNAVPSTNRGFQKRTSRILVVDDHPVVRRGIAQLIDGERDLEVCAEADSAAATLVAIDSAKPDLVILDLTLAGTSGLGLIKDVKVRHPDVPILVLSMHDESLYAERALRAGAAGYIMKQEATEHIVEAIRQVLRREVYLSERMATRMLHRFVGRPGDPGHLAPIETLTDRELEVFRLVGHGLSTRQIAAQLFLSVKTIETHLEHIKTKLGLESGRELVRHAVKWTLEN